MKKKDSKVDYLNKTVQNIDLWEDVIIEMFFTHLIIKQKVARNWIKKFLKMNLWDLQTAQKGQNVIYGINYEIKNNVLCFSGVAEEKFCAKTIVLQITDLRHKILKKVWIHGVNNYENGKLDTGGNNYEVL